MMMFSFLVNKGLSYYTKKFLDYTKEVIRVCSSNYDSIIILLGSFNMAFEDAKLNYLCKSFSLSSLITEPTFFKGSSPTYIDINDIQERSFRVILNMIIILTIIPFYLLTNDVDTPPTLHSKVITEEVINTNKKLIAPRFPRICLIYAPKNLKCLSEIR